MKYTVATVAAFASMALAQPAFTNTGFDVVEGKPFTIGYTGCDSGCTIILQNGESDDLDDYKTLTATAEGDSFTFTPSGLPTDTYNFKIVDNESGELNYSAQFDYEGTGVATTAASTTAASTTAVESTTAAESTTVVTTETSEVLTTLTSVKTSALTTLTKTSELTTIATPEVSRNATTPVPSKSGDAKPTTTLTDADSSETAPAATTVPESGAARMTSSLALIAGAIMAMVYL